MDLSDGRETWLSHHLETWEREIPPLGAMGSTIAGQPLGRTGAAAWGRAHESSESQPLCPELEVDDDEV